MPFPIPLAPGDSDKFTFSVPSTIFLEPYDRYQWTVLPQGIANSPTLCQEYVSWALTPFREKCQNQIYRMHYMDDILLSAKTEILLQQAFKDLLQFLDLYGLVVAPEKIQR